MKMEHVVAAERSGVVTTVVVAAGDTVNRGDALVSFDEARVEASGSVAEERVSSGLRADLADTLERHAVGSDERRPEAVARRRTSGQRTARENVEDLCDPGTFVEYGSLVLAAQRRRRALDDLMKNTPADGLVAGIGRVNGDLFDDSRAQCIAMSYDYTVLAGTQGQQNHRKKDRM